MKLKPLNENIIVKQFEEEKITKSGIIIAESGKGEKPQQGEVMAIGNKVLEIKIGDKVLFQKYSPNEIKIEDKEYLVMKESDVLAIIE